MKQSTSYPKNDCAPDPKPCNRLRRILICFSGKRKSGKDYVAGKLAEFLRHNLTPSLAARGIDCRISVIGISYLLKEEFARINGLDAEKLKSDGVYKETVRAEMVTYGDKIRNVDPGFFCRKALEGAISKEINTESMTESPVHVIIASDCRRPSDLTYFQAISHFNFDPELYKIGLPPGTETHSTEVMLVRINAAEVTRQGRGFVFTPGIDDAETECALDTFDGWHVSIENDGDCLLLKDHFQAISALVLQRV